MGEAPEIAALQKERDLAHMLLKALVARFVEGSEVTIPREVIQRAIEHEIAVERAPGGGIRVTFEPREKTTITDSAKAGAAQLEQVDVQFGMGERRIITLRLAGGYDVPIEMDRQKRALLRSALDNADLLQAMEPARH